MGLRWKGWNYKKLNRTDVEEQFFNGIKVNPQKASAYYYMGEYKEDYVSKEKFYLQAIAKYSFYLPAFKSLVKLYNENNDYEKSLSLLNSIETWNSNSPDIHNLLGDTILSKIL